MKVNIGNINVYLFLLVILSYLFINSVYFKFDTVYIIPFILILTFFYINLNYFTKYNFMILAGISILSLLSTFINIENIILPNLNALVFTLLLWSFLLISINSFNIDKFYFLLKSLIYFLLFISYTLFFLKIQESPDAYTFHQNILTGIFQNSFFASYVYFIFFVLVINFGRDKKEDYFILFLLLISMFLTLSRTGLICSLFILLILYLQNTKIILLGLLLVCIAIFFNDSYMVTKYYERLFSGTSNRIEFWSIVLKDSIVSIESFFFGYGPNQTIIEFNGGKYSAHNSYIALIGNYGYIFLIYVLFIVSVMIFKLKNNKKLLTSFLALLMFAFFDVSLFIGGTFGFFIYMFLYSMRKKLYIYTKELK